MGKRGPQAKPQVLACLDGFLFTKTDIVEQQHGSGRKLIIGQIDGRIYEIYADILRVDDFIQDLDRDRLLVRTSMSPHIRSHNSPKTMSKFFTPTGALPCCFKNRRVYSAVRKFFHREALDRDELAAARLQAPRSTAPGLDRFGLKAWKARFDAFGKCKVEIRIATRVLQARRAQFRDKVSKKREINLNFRGQRKDKLRKADINEII